MSKLNGGDMVQNVVSKTCKTLNLIDYDEGFNSLDSEIYIKYIRLVILNFCRIFSDTNSDLYKLITCDNLNNIHDFVEEISTDNKKTILDIFFDKDIETYTIDCTKKSDLSEQVKDDEMQGGDDLPTTNKSDELKNGWIEKENLQGKKYWYNTNTRETTDNQPEETKNAPVEDTEEDTEEDKEDKEDAPEEDKEDKEDKEDAPEEDKEDAPEEDTEDAPEEDKEDAPEEDKEEDTEEAPEEDKEYAPENPLDMLTDMDESILNKSDMSTKLLQSMVGLEDNTKDNKAVALEILNVLFNNKIIEIIKKDQAVIALLATFINNLYKQTRKYTNKDIIKNMQFCLEPFSQLAYMRHISAKLSLHHEYYKHTLNMVNNEKHLYLIPMLINHIQKYFIEIDNMIDIDMVLKTEIITSLKEKIEIVYKDNDAEQSRIINTFIDDMENISKLNEPLIDILIPKNNIQGGRKTRSKYRKGRKSRKLTKKRKTH